MPDINILYEDKDIVVVDKPAGLVVHSDGRTKESLLTDWIVSKYPEAKGVGEPISTTDGITIDRPGIVHRLDRETSGALLVARTSEGHAHLKVQFQDRTVSKKYFAFLYGKVEDRYGVINSPIGRSSKDFRKWTAGRAVRGDMRDAETWYTSIGSTRHFSLVEAEPKTGRTHQLRVHFQSINHPVVCDELYAPGMPPALGFERTALHARSIKFMDMKGEEVEVFAPFPEDFIKASTESGIDLPKNI